MHLINPTEDYKPWDVAACGLSKKPRAIKHPRIKTSTSNKFIKWPIDRYVYEYDTSGDEPQTTSRSLSCFLWHISAPFTCCFVFLVTRTMTPGGQTEWQDLNTNTVEKPAYLVKELDRSSYWTCFSEVVKPFKWQFSVPWGTESVMRPEHYEIKCKKILSSSTSPNETWNSNVVQYGRFEVPK